MQFINLQGNHLAGKPPPCGFSRKHFNRIDKLSLRHQASLEIDGIQNLSDTGVDFDPE